MREEQPKVSSMSSVDSQSRAATRVFIYLLPMSYPAAREKGRRRRRRRRASSCGRLKRENAWVGGGERRRRRRANELELSKNLLENAAAAAAATSYSGIFAPRAQVDRRNSCGAAPWHSLGPGPYWQIISRLRRAKVDGVASLSAECEDGEPRFSRERMSVTVSACAKYASIVPKIIRPFILAFTNLSSFQFALEIRQTIKYAVRFFLSFLSFFLFYFIRVGWNAHIFNEETSLGDVFFISGDFFFGPQRRFITIWVGNGRLGKVPFFPHSLENYA